MLKSARMPSWLDEQSRADRPMEAMAPIRDRPCAFVPTKTHLPSNVARDACQVDPTNDASSSFPVPILLLQRNRANSIPFYWPHRRSPVRLSRLRPASLRPRPHPRRAPARPHLRLRGAPPLPPPCRRILHRPPAPPRTAYSSALTLSSAVPSSAVVWSSS